MDSGIEKDSNRKEIKEKRHKNRDWVLYLQRLKEEKMEKR